MGIFGTFWLLYYMIVSWSLDKVASSRRIPRYNNKNPLEIEGIIIRWFIL